MHLYELKVLSVNVVFLCLVEGILFPGQPYLLSHLVNSLQPRVSLTSLITTNLGYFWNLWKTSYVATIHCCTSGTKVWMVMCSCFTFGHKCKLFWYLLPGENACKASPVTICSFNSALQCLQGILFFHIFELAPSVTQNSVTNKWVFFVLIFRWYLVHRVMKLSIPPLYSSVKIVMWWQRVSQGNRSLESHINVVINFIPRNTLICFYIIFIWSPYHCFWQASTSKYSLHYEWLGVAHNCKAVDPVTGHVGCFTVDNQVFSCTHCSAKNPNCWLCANFQKVIELLPSAR